MKLCTYCNIQKSVEAFNKCTNNKDGLEYHCKDCNKKKYLTNKAKINARRTELYYLNRDEELAKKAVYTKAHKQQKAAYDKIYRAAHREEQAKLKKEWESKNRLDPKFRLVRNLRRRIHHALKGSHKTDQTLKLLGCSIEGFKVYLEHQFLEDMSWDNYGLTGWHIDHINPCYTYDLSDPVQQRECFHYTNQRPLWASDNLSRSKSLVRPEL